jgi:hypothetical protein
MEEQTSITCPGAKRFLDHRALAGCGKRIAFQVGGS